MSRQKREDNAKKKLVADESHKRETRRFRRIASKTLKEEIVEEVSQEYVDQLAEDTSFEKTDTKGD